MERDGEHRLRRPLLLALTAAAVLVAGLVFVADRSVDRAAVTAAPVPTGEAAESTTVAQAPGPPAEPVVAPTPTAQTPTGPTPTAPTPTAPTPTGPPSTPAVSPPSETPAGAASTGAGAGTADPGDSLALPYGAEQRATTAPTATQLPHTGPAVPALVAVLVTGAALATGWLSQWGRYPRRPSRRRR